MAIDTKHPQHAHTHTNDGIVQPDVLDIHLNDEHTGFRADSSSEEEEQLQGLEAVARMAIETVASEANAHVQTFIDAAETRLIEAVTLTEQQQHDLNRWRDTMEEQLRTRLRDIGEWDEILQEKRTEVDGLREMAEAALSLASGDLETRWEAQQQELQDILATYESDERARWEAFMSTTAETLGNDAGGDPTSIAPLRAELIKQQQMLTTLQQYYQTQREQVVALQNDMRAQVESACNSTVTAVQAKFTAHYDSLHDWHKHASKDLETWHGQIALLEKRANAATEKLTLQTNQTVATMRHEIQQHARNAATDEIGQVRATFDEAASQSRAATQAETGMLRIENDRALMKLRRQLRTSQTLTFIIALVALGAGVAAILISYLHIGG